MAQIGMKGIETYVLIQLGRGNNFASPVVFIMSEKNVIKKLGYLRAFYGRYSPVPNYSTSGTLVNY